MAGGGNQKITVSLLFSKTHREELHHFHKINEISTVNHCLIINLSHIYRVF